MTITYTIGSELYLNITNKCTNNCVFCIRRNGPSVGDADDLWLEREPTREEILADIFKRDLSQYSEIVFCGYGEPLERLDDVVYICREIKKHGDHKIRINTNGQADLLYSRNTSKDLKDLVDVISISLNAADADNYQKICWSQFGECAFGSIVAYAQECRKYIPRVILTVVDVIGPEQVEKCRAIADRAGAEFRVREMIE